LCVAESKGVEEESESVIKKGVETLPLTSKRGVVTKAPRAMRFRVARTKRNESTLVSVVSI
jgi:hypothetical protein